MNPCLRFRSDAQSRVSTARKLLIVSLFVAVVLTIGFAGTIVAAGSLSTNNAESDSRSAQTYLLREPALRVRDAEPKDVPARDRDGYVEILTNAGIAHLPSGH
jgi:hypothetical protein